ncbi:MAG TPA: bifunctional precorrin-2 dehydrogenase/sirohydrochlorin ferrochelatase [Acidimicrobiales bacterium]|nr:bifunctional precorrin-2 dehydrogenase/sirohydrochlorin ferrochelatase [Acidimicrobiales bacterium]
MSANALPLALKLDGARVLVIGAGEVGARKTQQLLDAGALVTVISEDVISALPAGVAKLERRRYRPGDLRGYRLAISATGDATINTTIADEARREGVWLNVVDDPDRSTFFFTALHRDGEVTVSVSTNGAAPALAQYVRDLVIAALPSGLSRVADELRRERRRLHDEGMTSEGLDWRARIEGVLAGDTVSDF